MGADEAASAGTNGPGAAAVLAAAIGGFVLGVVALVADAFPAVARALTVWRPTGPLSGVTDITIIVWLVSWFALSRLWRDRNLHLGRVNLAAVLLFGVGLLLTFPPVMDFLQGK